MFHKYIKLLLVCVTVLQASPKVFNALGNELEAFQTDCKTFQEITKIPVEIQESCDTFYLQLDEAFDIGYKLDMYIDSSHINEKALDTYLVLLRHLDKRKEKILGDIYAEASKARKQNNFNYYGQLITDYNIELHNSDYEFMEENKKIFSQNDRYISHNNHMAYLGAEHLEDIKTKKTKKKKMIQSELVKELFSQSVPKAFNSLGNELEAFQTDCKTFQKIALIPVKIQESCDKFYLQLHKAFDVGYKLDSSVGSDNINEKELHAYLFLLRNLDKHKEKILGDIYAEASKARKQNNFNYYGQLITDYNIELHNSDYEFMEENKKIFSNHDRYISHNKYVAYLKAERLKKEKAKSAQYKSKPIEIN